MLLNIMVITVLIAVGVIISATGIGSSGGMMSFIAAFGLIMIIIFVGLILFAMKQKKK